MCNWCFVCLFVYVSLAYLVPVEYRKVSGPLEQAERGKRQMGDKKLCQPLSMYGDSPPGDRFQ